MGAVSMREAYGRALADYGQLNTNVVVLDADTSSSTLSNYFAKKFPERFFNLGIAEPCMVDVAVGMALEGMVPFVNAFAALLSLRALEQVRSCVCYSRTNVKLAAGYAGVSAYKDGASHHSITDIAIMRSLPGMAVVVPADSVEASAWVRLLAEYEGPAYLRLSRSATPPVHLENLELVLGKGLTLRAGTDLSILCCGSMVGYCLMAADTLDGMGISARVIEIHTIKPIDEQLVIQAAEETGAIVTAEEHNVLGGLGGAVAEILGKYRPTPIEQVGIQDTFAPTALSPEILLESLGLSVAGIVSASKKAFARKLER
jgi:transketolase